MIELIQGDCLQEMQNIENGSIDFILTDLRKELIPEMAWAKHLINDDMSIRSWCSQGFAKELIRLINRL